uniref:C-type lectin domain-containing protein n=1 Tax=Mastacembelus armatus TaxID=205130 RepID=A0A3Q3LEY3_9TELE
MKTLILAALLCALLALDTAQGEYYYTIYCVYIYVYGIDIQISFCFFTDSTFMGGHLASVRGDIEYGVIQKVIGDGKAAWIGGFDAQKKGVWFWTDGTPFTYTNWASGEPNNVLGLQHCLQMNYGAQKRWDDQNCITFLPSVCVKKL